MQQMSKKTNNKKPQHQTLCITVCLQLYQSFGPPKTIDALTVSISQNIMFSNQKNIT